jgi:hypothetical protein
MDRVVTVSVLQSNFPPSLALLDTSQRRATPVADVSILPPYFLTRKAASHFKATHFAPAKQLTARVLTFPPLSHGTLQTVEIGFNFLQRNCKTASVKVKFARKLH